MAQILDGRECARAVRAKIRREVNELRVAGLPAPHVVFIQVGSNPASTTYVNSKQAAALKVGMLSSIERLPAETLQGQLLELLAKLNADPGVHGILVQLPLPSHIDPNTIAQNIDPAKDVDCFHPANVGRMALGLSGPKPATPQGIMLLLAHFGITLAGCNAVVIGRSNLVGKPMALLLLQEGATVSCCHSATRDLAEHTRMADILVSAAGRANLVSAGMVKPGAVVVDVGINYVPTPDADLGEGGGTLLCGDVAYSEVEPLAAWISPVPGGVGPMTIASVLWNGLELFKSSMP